MFRPRLNTPDLPGRVMMLPDDYLVRRLHDHWAVVGPTGVFLVARADGDLPGCAERTAATAHTLRTRLSEVVPWVPFVDGVVVSEEHRVDQACTVVGIDGLESLLTQGPEVIGSAELQVLRHHLPGVVQIMEIDSAPLLP